MKKNGSKPTHQNAQPPNGTHRIRLSCLAPNVKQVFIAGDFNDWKPDTTPMHREPPNGEWTVALPLAAGRHEYKFVIDGQWCCEPGARDEDQNHADCCANSFGTMNRVLEVR